MPGDTQQLSDVEREVLAAVLRQDVELVAGGLVGAGSALETLGAARGVAKLLDDAVKLLARQARSEGAAWSSIGDALGVTRQAACQRFGGGGDDDAGDQDAVTMNLSRSDAARRGRRVVDLFVAGDFEAMRSEFDPRMLVACSGDVLSTLRRRLDDDLGTVADIARPSVRQRDRYYVADVPVTLDRDRRTIRVTLDHAGRVAGFFILIPQRP